MTHLKSLDIVPPFARLASTMMPARPWQRKKSASVRAQLDAIGVKVPDQKLAAFILEQTRVGLFPSRDVPRVFVWLHRLLLGRTIRKQMQFTVFTVPEHDEVAYDYGGAMPQELRVIAEQIERQCSDIRLEIHANEFDPGLIACKLDGSDKTILGVWYLAAGRTHTFQF